MPFSVEIIRARGAIVLRCRGRLVLGHGAGLLRELARRALASGDAVAVDVTRVTQTDAHAIGVLAELCATAREAGSTLMLAGASDRVRRLLRLTRLDSFLPEFEPAVMHTRAARPSPQARISLP